MFSTDQPYQYPFPKVGPFVVESLISTADFTAPSSSSDFVRIVGYAIDDDSSDVLIYFDPDKSWVEIA